MNNSTKFIDIYNRIDKYLENNTDGLQRETFSKKIRNSKNKVVQQFKDELLSFGELRNAIVHTPSIEDKPIAEPHEESVKRISELYGKIKNPIKVFPKFATSSLITCKLDDFIYKVIKKMKESSISQVPVFDDKNQIVEIINNNTISRWLSEHADDGGNFLIENEMVKDLIPEIEFRHNYKFISRDKSVYDARDLFFDHINTNKNYLDAIFITHSGKTDENLLGLITIEDISNL